MYFDNDYVEQKIKEYQETKNSEIVAELEPIFNKLIAGVIGKYKLLRRNYINDDLSQEAWIGILEAMPKWSKEKGDAFSFITGVAKNKIFWYLKNQYKDTSLTADDPLRVPIDDLQITSALEDPEDGNFDILTVKDFIKKLTVEELNLPDDEAYGIILESIKTKIAAGDNVHYEDLIKETQKEILIPKKKVRQTLDAIYAHFTGEL